ncbi:MAG: CHAT domain-containing protein, partial [Blastocatellia bacterium]
SNNTPPGVQDIRPFEPGKPIEREIASHETHSYQITLAAGQYLHVVAEQLSINVGLTLFGPDGNPLLDVRDWVESPERIWWIAESTGSYRLDVSTGKETPGRYRVRIEELRPATPRDRIRIVAHKAWFEGRELRTLETPESLPKALEKLREARQLWQTLDEPSLEAMTLLQIVIACNSLGEYQKAIEFGNQALLFRQAANDRYWEASVLIFIGEAYHSLSEYQKAIDFTQQSLPLWRARGDRSSEAWALNNIGSAYNSFGEKKLALNYYNQSLLAYQSAGEISGQALEHTQIGGLHASSGEKQKALDSLKQALALWEIRSDASRRESRTFYRLGEVYASLGESQLALEYYDRALRRLREGSDPVVESRILHSIGRVHVSLGKYQEALDYLNQALQLRRKIGNRQGEAYTLTYLGTVYFSLGDKQQALDYYNQALPLLRAVGDRYGEAYTLTYLGEVYASLGDQQKAIDYFGRALPIRQSVEDREGEADTRYQIARVERDRGNPDEAQAQIVKALEITEFVRANVLSQELRASYLATVRDYYELYVDLLMRLDERRPSEGFNAQALQASEQARARSLLEMLNEAGADIRQGVDPRLVERERQAQQRLNDKAELQTRLLSGKHTAEQAAAVAKEVAGLTVELREIEAQIRATSPRYAALMQPQPLSAAEIQQRVLDENTLLLEYALGEERSYLWAVTPTTINSFQLPKRAGIEAAAWQVYQLLTARNQFKDVKPAERKRDLIAQADAQYREASANLSQMLLGPVAAQLGNKRLLVVTQGVLQHIPFGALPAPARGRVEEWESGRQGDRGTRRQGDKTNPQSAIRNPQSFTPLIVDHEIINLPSASALAVLRRELANRKPAPKTVAVLADPVFTEDDERVRALTSGAERKNGKPGAAVTRERLRDVERALEDLGGTGGIERITRLSGTRWEADQIVSLVPAGQGLKALDFAANRSTATSPELGKYRILHFATHAFINDIHPELSGIILSLVDEQGRKQDGFLRAHEIFNLKLPADLVVLSACQTGLGKEVKGEGIIGLTRSFMYAGAPRVVVSLWSVRDKESAELMAEFYERMLGPERMSPAAALRAAQVEMWKKGRKPYYWAAFALQGEYK